MSNSSIENTPDRFQTDGILKYRLYISVVVLVTNINTKAQTKQISMNYSQRLLGKKEFGINYSHIPTSLLCRASTLLHKHQVQNFRAGPIPAVL
jgi:hypothetical protein